MLNRLRYEQGQAAEEPLAILPNLGEEKKHSKFARGCAQLLARLAQLVEPRLLSCWSQVQNLHRAIDPSFFGFWVFGSFSDLGLGSVVPRRPLEMIDNWQFYGAFGN